MLTEEHDKTKRAILHDIGSGANLLTILLHLRDPEAVAAQILIQVDSVALNDHNRCLLKGDDLRMKAVQEVLLLYMDKWNELRELRYRNSKYEKLFASPEELAVARSDDVTASR